MGDFENMIFQKTRVNAISQIFVRNLNSNIPTVPVKPPKFQGKITIDPETVLHLERLSLVDFANIEGIKRLEEAIEFAQPLKEVKTEGVEPMFTVLDDAAKTEEDYFVAPPGNIALKQDPKRFLKTTK